MVLVAAVAHAQAEPATDSAAEPDFLGMSLEELSAIKVPVVVGASKHEQKITEAPSAVSIVSADEIRRQGHRTLADILRSVRGFYVTYDRAYYAIGSRGVNRPGDYGGRTLITVDGHRLNDPTYDTAASGMDFLLDVDLIDRVEVIRGPGSSLYGNNAFFSVINIITRRGRDLNGAELSGAAASFDTYTGRVSYGKALTNGVELLLSGTLYDSAGDRRLKFPEYESINQGVADDLDGGWSRSTFARLSWKGLSLEGGWVDRHKTWPTAAYTSDDAIVIFNDPRFWTRDQRAFASAKLQHVFEAEWELQARAYFDHYQFWGQYPYDYLDPLQPVYLNRDAAVSDSVGFELQVSKEWLEKHRLTAGAEVRYDFRLEQENFDLDPPTSYLDVDETASIVSVYGQDEYQVWKNIVLHGGLRYDHFSTFGDTVNPRVALIYHPWEPSTIKLLYGQAFRAPNAYENYYEAYLNKRNPSLGPETIQSYEVVYEHQWSQHWRSTTSVFYNDIHDLIAYQLDPSDGLYFFDNLDAVVAKGGEIEIEGRWASGLLGRASYAFTRTEDAGTGLRLNNSPEHVAKMSLSVPLWRDKVFASVELQAMSERDTVREGKVSGVWLANTTLFSRELVKGLEVSATLYNLFNQRYGDPVSEDFRQDSIRQDGRTFRLKMTYHF